jgi:hypothetical protein
MGPSLFDRKPSSLAPLFWRLNGHKFLLEQQVVDDFQCSRNEEWSTDQRGARKQKTRKQGQWCPYGARVARLTLQELRAIAAQRGGQCLSLRYVNTSRHLRWKCAGGHQWDAISASVKKGSWCPHCVHNHKLRLQEMQQIARDRGGSCISKRYTNNETALLWECRRGHRWKATPSNVKRGTVRPQRGERGDYSSGARPERARADE